VIQKLRELSIGGAQVKNRRFDLRLVLHSQQLDAIEVDLSQVARLEAGAADLNSRNSVLADDGISTFD